MFAIIQFTLTFFWVFADLGLGRVIIQMKEEPDKVLLRSIWWIHLFLALLIGALIWSLSPLILSFYGGELEKQAVGWLRILVFANIIGNLNSISPNLLERHLLYRRSVIGEVTGLFTTQYSTILFAIWGLGTASFVYAYTLSKIVQLLVYYLLYPWPFGFSFNFNKLKSIFKLGLSFQLTTIVGLFNGAIIAVFIGRFPGPGHLSGAEAVGLITWAGGVAAVPSILASIIDQIVFPLMSRLQHNLKLAEKIFSKFMQIILISTFGLSSLVLVLSSEVTRFIYGQRWLDGLTSLNLAIIQTSLTAINALVVNTLLALGEVKYYRNFYLIVSILQWILTVPLVMIFGFWGVNLAMVIVSISTFVTLSRVYRYFTFSYLRIFIPPLILSILTGLSILVLKSLYKVDNLISLLAFLLFGLFLYTLLIYIFMKKEIIKDLVLVRSITLNYLSNKIFSKKGS